MRQPLLQGAGKEFNTIAGPNAGPGSNFSNGILIAQLNTRISNADFQIAVRTFVAESVHRLLGSGPRIPQLPECVGRTRIVLSHLAKCAGQKQSETGRWRGQQRGTGAGEIAPATAAKFRLRWAATADVVDCTSPSGSCV